MKNCRNCGKPLTAYQKTYCSRRCCGKMATFKPPESSILLADVKEVSLNLGRAPTWMEYLRLGNYHPATLWHRFGPWYKILDLIGYPPIPDNSWSIDSITSEDGGWLAGFFAGEGHFDLVPIAKPPLQRFDPIVSIAQRADNWKPIQQIIDLWQLSPIVYRVQKRCYVEDPKRFPCKPIFQLAIRDTPTISQKVIPTFLRYPMRSKKQLELEILEKAIRVLVSRRESYRLNRPYTDEERTHLTSYHLQIRQLREYIEPDDLSDCTFQINTYTTKSARRYIDE